MNNTEKVLEKMSGTIEDRGELPFVSDYETLEAAISTYGIQSQLDMAIEEMSELTKALLKSKRYAKLYWLMILKWNGTNTTLPLKIKDKPLRNVF